MNSLQLRLALSSTIRTVFAEFWLNKHLKEVNWWPRARNALLSFYLVA